jgi:hypothetical protein
MLKNISWVAIKGEFDRVKDELKITDDAPIALSITPKHGDSVTRRIRFGQFLEAMWRLYDSNREITKVSATQAKDGATFFAYDTPSGVDEKKPSGNNPIILEWKKLTNNAKDLYLNILLTQILEDNSCIQIKSTPPSGSPL